MQTRITARHFDASLGLRTHVEESLAKLERFYDRIYDAHVILEDHPSPEAEKRAEIALNVYRRTLTASDTAPSHRAAVDGCVRQLKRQVVRYKEKLRDKKGTGVARP